MSNSRNIAVLLMCALLAAFIGYALHQAINTPVVHFSWSTKECVRVLGPEGHPYSCENLPDSYERVWVR